MAPRVHSSSPPSSSPQPASATCTGEQMDEVWMKSLVLNGYGCTVYDSDGGIVYRVDNYGSRCGGSVFLMDLDGNIVLNVLKKKLAFGKWEVYKWRGQKREPRTWFTVARPCRPFQWSRSSLPPSSSCVFQSDTGRAMRYTVADECRAGKGTGKQARCRIVDNTTGIVIAEVKRKMTASGVALGDDVLALVVEPDVGHSLAMGLVLVYGLMNHSM